METMKFNKRNVSTVFLILGLAFLGIGLVTDNTIFSWISVVLVLLSLILGGRWLRPRRK
jgi:hypothetical protein